MVLSKNERRLLAVLCVVALCAAYWVFLFSPMQARAAQLSEEIDAANETIARNAAGAARLEPLLRDTETAEARIEERFPGLSATRDQSAWARAIEGMCTDGARLIALRFTEETRSDALGVQTAQLEIRTSQRDVSAFIDAISSHEPLMSIAQLTVSLEEGGQCRIKAVLQIPYLF